MQSTEITNRMSTDLRAIIFSPNGELPSTVSVEQLNKNIKPLSHWGPYVLMPPVLVAAECGRFALAKEMVTKGSNPHAVFDAEGDTLLTVVFRHIPLEMAKSPRETPTALASGKAVQMLRAGLDLQSAFAEGSDIANDPRLPFADFDSWDRAAAEFIAWGIKDANVNPNLCEGNGLTPLLLAVRHGAKECVKALIHGGANVHYVSHNLTSILKEALRTNLRNGDEIRQVLINSGLDPSTPIDPMAIERSVPSCTEGYHARNTTERCRAALSRKIQGDDGEVTVRDTVGNDMAEPLAHFEGLRKQAVALTEDSKTQ